MGVEPTGDTARCHPPVLKTGTITGPHALPLSGDQINIEAALARFSDPAGSLVVCAGIVATRITNDEPRSTTGSRPRAHCQAGCDSSNRRREERHLEFLEMNGNLSQIIFALGKASTSWSFSISFAGSVSSGRKHESFIFSSWSVTMLMAYRNPASTVWLHQKNGVYIC